jgi:uncharacterized protein YndB with AHSA1/START domain
MTNEALKTAEKNEVLITRIVNAPRQLVYDCWTKAEHLGRWYAPDNCTCVFKKIDVKPGGGYHGAIIHMADGRKNWFYAVFKEIDAPKKLVFTLARADEHGNHLSPKDCGMPDEWPELTVVTLTFEDLGDQTKFTLHQTVDLALATSHGAYPSWLQMLDRMEALITK